MFGSEEKQYLSELLQGSRNSFKAFAYERLTVDGTVKKLTVPTDAKYALLKLTSDQPGNAASYLEFNLPVSTTNGIPISDGTVFDITDYSNLVGFEITQIVAGTTLLYVQYYR